MPLTTALGRGAVAAVRHIGWAGFAAWLGFSIWALAGGAPIVPSLEFGIDAVLIYALRLGPGVMLYVVGVAAWYGYRRHELKE